MTVESLETAKAVVEEAGDIVAVYEYHHVITGKKLWSVETLTGVGTTLTSQYVTCPRLVYDGAHWVE